MRIDDENKVVWCSEKKFVNSINSVKNYNLIAKIEFVSENKELMNYKDLPDYADDRKWFKFIEAMQKDYEFKLKEKMYVMRVPYQANETLYYCIDDYGRLTFKQGNIYKFTEESIKEFFPDIIHLAEECK